MVKVSVIIPVYNVDQYLARCLESICNQTLQGIEIICVNDCSADNSLTILKHYAAKDKRIKIINFTENKGVSFARNSAIDLAQGEYVGFVDSDDTVDLDFFEKLYHQSLETKPDAIKGQIKKVGHIKKTLQYENIHAKVKKNPANFCNNFTSAIYKTSFLKKNKIYFPLNTLRLEDIYFSIKASFYYKSIEFVDGIYYHYIDNNETATNNYSDKSVTSGVDSMLKLFKELNNFNLPEAKYIISYDNILICIRSFIKHTGVSHKAKEYALKILKQIEKECKHKKAYEEYCNQPTENIDFHKNLLTTLRKSLK